MPLSITRRYSFEAAHFLPKVHDGHRCKRMHGHNYEIEVKVAGHLGEEGFVIDFWELDKQVQPLVDILDHRTLNDIPGLENPTAEYIAIWFLKRIMIASEVRVYETSECFADASEPLPVEPVGDFAERPLV